MVLIFEQKQDALDLGKIISYCCTVTQGWFNNTVTNSDFQITLILVCDLQSTVHVFMSLQ